MLERDDETPDPYPKPGPNMKNRLMIPFERILKQFEELPEPIKNNHTDHIHIAKLRYYESFLKRLSDNGEQDMTDLDSVCHKYHNANKDDVAGEGSKSRKIKRKGKNLEITFQSKRDCSWLNQHFLKSEYTLAAFQALHSKNDEDMKEMMTKQNLTENFAGKICPKTSTYTIGRIDIHKGLNTEGIKDHKDRPGLPQKTQGKEKPVHRTIHEHNIQRQDFERLCSNHTIKQYDVEYENTRKRLNGQPGTNELQFMNKKIKLEFGDTLKLNKTADYDGGTATIGFDFKTHPIGKFHQIDKSRPGIKQKLEHLMNSNKAFEMSQEDINKRKARLEAEKAQRGNNRNNFSSMF